MSALAVAVSRFSLAPWAVGTLVSVLATARYISWEMQHRGAFLYDARIYAFDDADDWRYVACSRLLLHGYHIFSDIFSAQPPLLFFSIAAGMRVFGESLAGAQTVELGFGLVAIWSIIWIAWQLRGAWAACSAAVILALTPGFLVYTHTVDAEGPMMALVSLVLAILIRYRRAGGRWLPVVAGLILCSAILVKLFAVVAILPALWLLWRGSGLPRRRTLLPAILFLVAAIGPALLELVILSPADQWNQVVSLHQSASTLHFNGLEAPIVLVWRFLVLDPGLSLLAAAGLLVALWPRDREQGIFLGLWLVGTIVMLSFFRPVFPHHPAILTAPLAAAAATLVGAAANEIKNLKQPLVSLAIIAGLTYVVLIPRLISIDGRVLIPGTRGGVSQLAKFVRSNSTHTEMVVADDLAIPNEANRLVPPPLCDPSNVRVRSGFLTAVQLETDTRKYRAAVVVSSLGIFQQISPYVAWLNRNYRVVRPFPGSVAFLRRRSD